MKKYWPWYKNKLNHVGDIDKFAKRIGQDVKKVVAKHYKTLFQSNYPINYGVIE